jgi:hypothetical protein
MATTTPNYGWDVPTSTDYVKDGATAIETLGDDIDATLYSALGGNYPGLRLIKKQTIGSAVATVTVTDAFSATYENYRIIISGGVSSADCYLRLRLGASTAGYSGSMMYTASYTATSVSVLNDNAAAQFSYAGDGRNAQYLCMNVDLIAPFLSKFTRLGTNISFQSSSGAGNYTAIHGVATSYTDFTVIPSGAATLTGGTIYVYGYGAS